MSFAHPARLAAQAMQRGLRDSFDESFHYLELGCGAGGNLLPLAARFPEARFTGIDSSADSIAVAEAARSTLGLSNLTLIVEDIRRLEEASPHDYVVAHGVYSWVEPATQEALLRSVKRALAPRGVALVSYNTLPGWGVRGMVRDVMRRAAAGEQAPRAKLKAARLMLTRLLRQSAEDHPYAALLRAELSLVLGKRDGYLLSEYLGEHNEALYVADFLERAAAAGLGFLAEGAPATADGLLELGLEQDAAERPLGERLTELDLLSYRQFRATSLCHAEARPSPLSQEPLRERGYLSAQLTPMSREPLLAEGEELSFRADTGAVLASTSALHKASLWCLARAYPEGMRAAELVSSALQELRERGLGEQVQIAPEALERLLDDLLELVRRRQLELLPWSPKVARRLGEGSSPAALTRLEAAGGVVTSARHHAVELSPLHAELLQLVGSAPAHQVMDTLRDLARAGELRLGDDERAALESPEALAELVGAQLRASLGLGLFPAS
ncbi:MAG: class I SAM-dependent methyltransferase [Polyangiaceae bacterium]|nr:class I SAM-dependent methyltransferase [Polyangiaceae bacterium]